jgi:hypothetical protein
LLEGVQLDSSVLGGWSSDLGLNSLFIFLPHSRYNVEVKHIKIMTSEGLYRITEKKAFRGLLVRAAIG